MAIYGMRFLPVLIYFIALQGCIEEISFEAPSEVGVLVVDGNLSTSSDSNFVRLSRTDKLGRQVFPPEIAAKITLIDQDGTQEEYLDLGGGKYWLKGEIIHPRVGATYQLNIELLNGHKYQSQPEHILPAPGIDSLSFQTAIEDIIVGETRELSRSVIDFFVHGRISTSPSETYLQWQVEQVSAVSEITCSPFVAPKTCYIYQKTNPNELLLLDGSLLQPSASYAERVSKRVIDFTYGQLTSYLITQRSITKDAFIYLQRVDRVVNEVGSIFDAPPAAIPGNLASLDDPDELVLGYFSAYDERSSIRFIESKDLGDRRKLPLCGIPGFPPNPFIPACCNCLMLEKSSKVRPPYWP